MSASHKWVYSDSIQISVQQHNFNETILSKSSMNHSKPIRGQLNIGFLWQRINNIKFVKPKIGFTDIPQHVCTKMSLSLTLPTRNAMSATYSQEYCWNDVTWQWTDVVGMTGFNEKHLWSGKNNYQWKGLRQGKTKFPHKIFFYHKNMVLSLQ